MFCRWLMTMLPTLRQEIRPLYIFYDFNPMKPLDLLKVTLWKRTNTGATKRAKKLRKIKLTKKAMEGTMPKLMPHGVGPFQVLQHMNNDAYKIDTMIHVKWSMHELFSLLCHISTYLHHNKSFLHVFYFLWGFPSSPFIWVITIF
jgi:hypothetical protein